MRNPKKHKRYGKYAIKFEAFCFDFGKYKERDVTWIRFDKRLYTDQNAQKLCKGFLVQRSSLMVCI